MWIWHPDKGSLLCCPLNPFAQFIGGCGLLKRFRKSGTPGITWAACIHFTAALCRLLLEEMRLYVALKQVLVPSRWERALNLNCSLIQNEMTKLQRLLVFFLKRKKRVIKTSLALKVCARQNGFRLALKSSSFWQWLQSESTVLEMNGNIP